MIEIIVEKIPPLPSNITHFFVDNEEERHKIDLFQQE